MAFSLSASAVSYGTRFLADQVCSTGILSCDYVTGGHAELPSGYVEGSCVPYNDKYASMEGNYLILILTALLAASMAFAIGGNDGANAWATTVHSFAITLKPACILAAFFEVLGATTIGYGVSTSIQKGISNLTSPDCFACGYCNSSMDLYYVGMMGALISGSIFLLTATFMKLPVSTTHTIVSSVFGMTVAFHGFGCVRFGWDNLGGVVASWFISPAAAGVVTLVFYYMTQFLIFRAANPRQRAMIFVPVLYFAVVFVVVFLIMVKAPVSKDEPHWKGILVGLGAGTFTLIIVITVMMPRIKKGLPSLSEANRIGLHMVRGDDADTVMKGEAGEFVAVKSPDVQKEGDLINSSVVRPSMELLAEYDSLTIEQQDAMYMFKHLLILVACLQSFSHGSNDTANATAAFAAVVKGFQNGINDCSSPDSPWWTMLLGGVFLGAGIWFIGYKVMDTVGKNISVVTFDRAFCTEFASACTVVVCSLLEIPVSTTHCQVGAVIFISIAAKDAGAIQWRLVTVILFSWVATLPFTAGFAALVSWLLKFAMEA
ncbi:Inorganic phosphate transporter, partial [Globisporangium splendens]